MKKQESQYCSMRTIGDYLHIFLVKLFVVLCSLATVFSVNKVQCVMRILFHMLNCHVNDLRTKMVYSRT